MLYVIVVPWLKIRVQNFYSHSSGSFIRVHCTYDVIRRTNHLDGADSDWNRRGIGRSREVEDAAYALRRLLVLFGDGRVREAPIDQCSDYREDRKKKPKPGLGPSHIHVLPRALVPAKITLLFVPKVREVGMLERRANKPEASWGAPEGEGGAATVPGAG